MTIVNTLRILALVPAAVGLSLGLACAQEPGVGAGGMAYPNSLPSGQVRIPAQKGRDAASESYPNSPGGVTVKSPTGTAGGGMASPTGLGSLPANTATASATQTGTTAKTRIHRIRRHVAATTAPAAQ